MRLEECLEVDPRMSACAAQAVSHGLTSGAPSRGCVREPVLKRPGIASRMADAAARQSQYEYKAVSPAPVLSRRRGL